MAVQTILQMGDARLWKIAKPVEHWQSLEFKRLITDMLDTMQSANGVGLAAPQIGVDLAVVIYQVSSNPRYPNAPDIPLTVLTNPQLIPLSAEMCEDWEGCLSVPGLRGLVPRYRYIYFKGFDANGDFVEGEAKDFHARVLQHESDHLIGRLYPSRMTDMKKFGFINALFPDLPTVICE